RRFCVAQSSRLNYCPRGFVRLAVHAGTPAATGAATAEDWKERASMNLRIAKHIVVIAATVLTLGSLGADRQSLSAQGAAGQAPIFEVDPFWPKPLSNHWVTGSTIGLSVDAQDNVWTIHRPNTVEDNFKAADIKVGEARGRDDEAQ